MTFAILFVVLDIGFVVVCVTGLIALSRTCGLVTTLVIISILPPVILPLLACVAKFVKRRKPVSGRGNEVESGIVDDRMPIWRTWVPCILLFNQTYHPTFTKRAVRIEHNSLPKLSKHRTIHCTPNFPIFLTWSPSPVMTKALTSLDPTGLCMWLHLNSFPNTGHSSSHVTCSSGSCTPDLPTHVGCCNARSWIDQMSWQRGMWLYMNECKVVDQVAQTIESILVLVIPHSSSLDLDMFWISTQDYSWLRPRLNWQVTNDA